MAVPDVRPERGFEVRKGGELKRAAVTVLEKKWLSESLKRMP
jgi:hypothetical protein